MELEWSVFPPSYLSPGKVWCARLELSVSVRWFRRPEEAPPAPVGFCCRSQWQVLQPASQSVLRVLQSPPVSNKVILSLLSSPLYQSDMISVWDNGELNQPRHLTDNINSIHISFNWKLRSLSSLTYHLPSTITYILSDMPWQQGRVRIVAQTQLLKWIKLIL